MWTLILTLLLASHIGGLLAISHLLLSRKRTTSLVLWALWLLLLPAVGIPLYLTLGSDRIRQRSIPSRLHKESEKKQTGLPKADPLLETVASIPGNILTAARNIELLPDTRNYYPHLLQSIEDAKDFIHIQTYVFRMDSAGDRFLEALSRAARRGVEVRLLVDEMGSAKTRSRYFEPLTEAGGKFSWCMTIHPLRNRYFFNLRNHRKIQVIDGTIAYVGGMNIGEEYEGKNPDIGPWRDMQMKVEGPIVGSLQDVFARDWEFATQEELPGEKYRAAPEGAATDPHTPAAVINSGPNNPSQSFLKSFVLTCNRACKRLDVFTPYFGPETSVIVAMQIAARRGVRVRMMIPTPNEHQYMVDIGRAHYEQLMEDGVEIYEYHEAVHHGKLYIIDDDLFVLGSTNLDARSLRINFETTVLMEDSKVVRSLDEYYEAFFEKAERVDLERIRNQPLGEKLKQGAARLFAPIL